jgi:hypothetical protein
MEVEFNPGLSITPGAGQPVTRQPNTPTPPADTTMSFERTQALEKTLQETPDIRPEAVTRATALVSDGNYPSDEALNKMAGFLANKISGSAGGQD